MHQRWVAVIGAWRVRDETALRAALLALAAEAVLFSESDPILPPR
jgi:hypothetical protein